MDELPRKEIPYVCIYYIHIWTTRWVFPTPCCRHWHKSGARTTSLSISFHTLSGPIITPSGYDFTSNIFVQLGASMQNMDATNFLESNKLVGWIVGSQVTYFAGVVGPEAPSKPKESYFAFAVLISGTIFGQRKTCFAQRISFPVSGCKPRFSSWRFLQGTVRRYRQAPATTFRLFVLPMAHTGWGGTTWATFKTLMTFQHTACLIGILIMAFYSHYITGWYNRLAFFEAD